MSKNWPVERPRKAEEDSISYENVNDHFSDHVHDEGHDGKPLSLDEIPFDRDLKWVNVASGSRPRPRITPSIRNPFLKQVQSITTENATEFGKLDEHYRLKFDIIPYLI